MRPHPPSRAGLRIPVVLIACAAVTTCREASPPTGAVAIDGTLLARAHAAASKVNMCHVEGNGRWHPIWIAADARGAHDEHGDWEVTEEVCDQVDNDCGGWVDEEGCGESRCDVTLGLCTEFFAGMEAEATQLERAINNFEEIKWSWRTGQKPDRSEVIRLWNELAEAMTAYNAALKTLWPRMVQDQREMLMVHPIDALIVITERLASDCNREFSDMCQVEYVQTKQLGVIIRLPDIKGE